ncbi:DUF3624 domain-containing protein [Shewanella glacialipiscicola]|uniref:DUF3624 domain-containing protein n=1 Tax=Shewanella glacialipiscicola TaxID=614069 RepID=UPI003D7BD49C
MWRFFRQKHDELCIRQLTVLSVISWPLWWFLYRDTPREVNSIALLFFCSVFTGLLALHLIVLAYRRLRGRE